MASRTPSKQSSKSKSTGAPAQLTLSTQALAHGDGSFGAQFVKPGFAFTPEMDLAFALG